MNTIKLAKADYPILPIIKERWSPRALSESKIEKSDIQSLFEAARWAPSAMNEQPWRFIVGIKDESDTWQRIFDCLLEGNRIWAFRAPVLALGIIKTHYSNGNKNEVASYDLGQSIAYLSLEASSRNLYIHQLGGIDRLKATAEFKVPEGYEVILAFLIAKKGEPEILLENHYKLETTERKRKTIQELTFGGDFGTASDL